MINTFITSFKIRNTYRVNSIIYAIKGIPFIKRYLPDSLYMNKGLKTFGNIISVIIEIVKVFLFKFLFILLLIFCMLNMYKVNQTDLFLHIFLLMTTAAALLDTYIFNPTKDKYYAIILLKMDAKKFAISNYYYILLCTIIGYLPFTIIFGLIAKVPILICVFLPFLVVLIRMIQIFYNIKRFERIGIVDSENAPTKIIWTIIILLLALAYGLPFLNIMITQTSFIVVSILIFILGIISYNKINTFGGYSKMYKQLLTEKNVYVLEQAKSSKVVKETISKSIEQNDSLTSNKTGYALFHDLFVKRHSKLLTKAIKKQSIIITLIFITIIIAICLLPVKTQINEIPLTWLPYFVFILYFLNRGTTLTQAMFMNCDHSMLTYGFYRTPKVILGVFKERLKTLILYNLAPALLIATGLIIILYLSGGTSNPLNYVVLLVSILAISIFFSVHYLVMYYLLQPYNIETEIKNATYKIVQSITYFFSFIMIQIKLPTIAFGVTFTIFSIVYSLVSLLLVYKLAPSTFKIRL